MYVRTVLFTTLQDAFAVHVFLRLYLNVDLDVYLLKNNKMRKCTMYIIRTYYLSWVRQNCARSPNVSRLVSRLGCSSFHFIFLITFHSFWYDAPYSVLANSIIVRFTAHL
jgi:hypothetical protein